MFVDSDQPPGDAQTNEWPNLQTKSEAVKENKASATDGALHQRPVVPHTPKVAIFRDAVSIGSHILRCIESLSLTHYL